MQLNKLSFRPGEDIEGTVRVKLKKPKQGKELSVRFVGKKIDKFQSHSGVLSSDQKHGSQTKVQKIHDFKMPLAGEQEYSEHEFTFKIPIPADILAGTKHPDSEMSEGAQAGITALKVVAGGTSHTGTRLEWYVKANLDMPGLDMNKKQDIVLME